jgi:hypothetical protein
MFGSVVLDVAIGIVFVFLLISMICSAIREGIEAWMKTRAAYLEQGIRELLHDTGATGIAAHFFAHPLIYSLYSGGYARPQPGGWWPVALTRGRNLPSYIPRRNFALALLDIAARGPITDDVSSHPAAGVVSLDAARANILNIGNAPVQRVLLTAIDTAEGDFHKAVANVEAWFDSGMDRVSGGYKRSTQWMLFVIAVVVAIALNVNTLAIVNHLYRDTAARAALVARAQAVAPDATGPNRTYPEIRNELSGLNLPIGWTVGLPQLATVPGQTERRADWFQAILGWLITAFAATLGAPFWFDVLNKVMVIRSTVKPHEKSPEESSEDRQPSKDRNARNSDVPPSSTNDHRTAGAAGIGAPASSQTDLRLTPTPTDRESRVDGCDVPIGDQDLTPDEELPEAEGGIA